MIIVGVLIIVLGLGVIVLRKQIHRGIASRAKKIGNSSISRSVKFDTPARIIEVGVVMVLIGLSVVLYAVGIF
ncbi:hypothetical protein [Microbacterium sp. EST19A]|uniref:hypothetical protein n=1 Tax=Microbacterium sp. EST19A TaxID=2862681 RepID=UPI001CBCA8D7|nr:hypothetical protein [Microbacterium sp. EST19A]